VFRDRFFSFSLSFFVIVVSSRRTYRILRQLVVFLELTYIVSIEWTSIVTFGSPFAFGDIGRKDPELNRYIESDLRIYRLLSDRERRFY
jgi:hypothetical protein